MGGLVKKIKQACCCKDHTLLFRSEDKQAMRAMADLIQYIPHLFHSQIYNKVKSLLETFQYINLYAIYCLTLSLTLMSETKEMT